MTPIEWMALVVALITGIKLIIGIINPRTWMAHVVVPIWRNPVLVTIIAIILGLVSLNYLIAEVTIVQIFAVLFFLMSVMVISFVPYSKDIIAFGSKVMKDRKFLKKEWFALLVWIILVVWALIELFT